VENHHEIRISQQKIKTSCLPISGKHVGTKSSVGTDGKAEMQAKLKRENV